MDKASETYLLSQRKRMRSRIGMLRGGRSWRSETRDGQHLDTTAETLTILEDNLEEIDELLSNALVPLDA